MSHRSRQQRSWNSTIAMVALMTMLLAITTAFLTPAPAVAAPGSGRSGHDRHRLQPGPVDVPRRPARSPHRPSRPVRGNPVDRSLVGTHAIDPIDMKILVISADGNETTFPAIKAFLGQIGIPYTVYQVINPATGAKTPLTREMLWDGALHGYYQAVMLSTDSLVYFDTASGTWPSALTAAEWQTLWTYESTFKIRQVTFNTTGFGPEPFGLNWPAWNDAQHRLTWQQTAATPVNGTLTSVGQTQFPYLKSSVTVPIANADTVLATAGSGVNTLLTTTGGYALVSTYTNPTDGRQNLAITADGASYLTHSLLLSYGAINWATKGLFLGERHVYLNPQADDIGIDDDVWDTTALTDTTGLSIRMTGNDLNAIVSWQNGVRANANSSQFRLEYPFNGSGFSSAVYPGDTLTPAVIANRNQFNWINHTWTHQNMDGVSATTILRELTQNYNWGVNTGKFTANSNFYKDTMIQPDISGLYYPTFMQTAYNFGIRYIISDTSRNQPQFPDNWDNPSPNAGYYRGLALVNSQKPINPPPSLLVIPRHASSLFYNLYTPAQWVSEYNCYFSYQHMEPGSVCARSAWKYWQTDLTYNQIIDNESTIILQYMLKWDVDPIMFHQPNTVQYASGKTLMTDLLNAVLTKYNSMYNLPILSPGQHNIGVKMANRMAYNTSGVTAQLIACGTPNATPSITLKTVSPALIPLTGVAFGSNREVYGGQNISYINLAANQSITIPITC